MPLDSTGFDAREAPAPADVVPMLGRRLLEVFGPNGENWFQGAVCDPQDHRRMCLVGAARFVVTGSTTICNLKVVERLYAALPAGVCDGLVPTGKCVALWNDSPDRTFEDIRQLCLRLRLTRGDAGTD